MTLRALGASILCMVLTAIYTNHTAIVVRETWTIPESVIPVPAILALLGLTLFTGLLAAVFKLRLLTRQEVVCVAFATLMSAPLMTQGFWLRFLGMIAATPMGQNFDYIDAFDDRLWPHGENLLSASGAQGAPPCGRTGGSASGAQGAPPCGRTVLPRGAAASAAPLADTAGTASWRFGEIEEGRQGAILVITNAAPGEVSYAEYTFTAGAEAAPDFREPFLISVLARGEGADAETAVFAETVADGAATPTTLFRAAPSTQKTWLHKTGFVRLGRYGVYPARACQSNLVLRIGLKGRGSVEIADPRFFSVAPLMGIFQGRKIVEEAEWERMTPAQRPPYAAVRPAKRWSLRSLAFHLGGLVPFRPWARPLAIWGGYVLLLLTALFCLNTIMRRKWAESERYPMPNARIPLALAGAGPGDEGSDAPFAAIWRNRWAWAGLIFAFLFGILKGAHFFNPHFPDLKFSHHLGDYVSNPVFGGMFNVTFTFSLLICSVAVFFELNVLMSIVVGYWVCRSAYFFGHLAGIDSNSGFPWFDEQALGAYIGYFAIILVLSSKYLWGVVRDAFRGRNDGTEALAPRTAVVLFVLCHVGVALWSGLSDASLLGMQVMFSFLVICGFIAAKYRVECGSPFGYFAPQNVMLLVGALGGMRVFGARGMFVSLLLSGVLTAAVFYLIPGMQFEMIEIGHRLRIKPRHIAYTCLVGALGGLLIGGLVFLSNGYAAGANTLRGNGFYDSYGWFVTRIRTPLTLATTQWLNPESAASAPATNWGRVAMASSGVTMAVLAILRQYFAGFWFHPIGFMVGFTFQNFGANWGTLLVAFAIRWSVLKIGGAKAVRTKMMPFFVGVFVGCVLAIGLFTLVNGYAVAHGNANFYNLTP
ncbi:MAG: hypothetical protein IJQ73_08245 [Kiritimatiellae bacterium]|nr:hypothetical protein [Kiritimatiellia bacterium]